MRVGSRLDIVLETDLEKDQALARKAMVYNVQERRLTISQTAPPLFRRHIGERVNASYIITGGGKDRRRPVRMGFSATVQEYVEAYTLSSSNLVPAFVLQQEGQPAEINLRMHYRIRPTAGSDLTLLANGGKVNLIDISIGGVQFSQRRKEPPLEYGDIALTLSSGGRTFKIDGQIVRISNPTQTSGHAPDLEYVMVKFLRLDQETESFLGRKIMMIERQLMSEGKI